MYGPDLPCSQDPDMFLAKAHQERARRICTVCTFQPTCLEQALDFQRISGEPLQGMVAGFLPEERTKIYRRRSA